MLSLILQCQNPCPVDVWLETNQLSLLASHWGKKFVLAKMVISAFGSLNRLGLVFPRKVDLTYRSRDHLACFMVGQPMTVWTILTAN
jgi:hypothetical protein